MNRKRWWGLATAVTFVAISGCGVDITSSDEDDADETRSTSGASPSNGRARTPLGSDPPSDDATDAAPSDECPVGTWRLRDLRAIGDADAARIEFSGGGSLTIAFAADGMWTLTDDGSKPLQASLDTDGYRLDGEAAIAGTATGTYADVGSAYVFDMESSSGEARISAPGYNDTVGMASVAEVLLPTGQATLDCDEDTLRLKSDGVSMTLSLLPPRTSDASADPGSGLTIESSGTRDCAGRSVTIDAELEDVFLEGECGVVTLVSDNTAVTTDSAEELVVLGSLNEISVHDVGAISISGSSNEIFWRAAIDGGEPTIRDDGPFNTVQQR